MKVAILGGTGLVGRALTRSLVADGSEVTVLTRDIDRRSADVASGARVVEWSAEDVPRSAAAIEGLDAVVNLAGAPVAPWPWTTRRKGVIRSSRVDAVRSIVDAMARLPTERRPKTLVVVSGVDAYPESAPGDDPAPMAEDHPLGSAFLAQVSRVVEWSAEDVPRSAAAIEGLDAVVNLAGAPVAPWPWTSRRKGVIRSSRVDAVRSIVDAMARLPTERRPKTLVVVSGIDAYPESPPLDDPAPMTEDHPLGSAFLAQVSRDVEDEAERAQALGVRVVRLRMGHVLARDAKLVWYLALPVRLFLGGRIGSGRQWLSWVHIDDAVGLFRLALTEPSIDGPLNVTSPGACRQRDFVRAMARVLRRPAWFPAPAWLVRMVLGEQSVLLLGSRRVAPARALALGFDFRHAGIDQALEDVLGGPVGG